MDKIFFNHITNMKDYRGFEENVIGGGGFVTEEGYGYELFNFENDNGKCYGYTVPRCGANLERISKKGINEDALGKYLDDVLVVFTCTGKSGKRVIAGFYQNARVYANAVNDNRVSRLHKGKYIPYNLICDTGNTLLISQNERIFEIPYAKSKEKIGHGQHNTWYADKDIDKSIRNSVVEYLNNFIANKISDEAKYYYNENKRSVITTQQIIRSREARDKCIELKGCYCNICGFDFQKTYGDLGKNYIEVHHITSIGELTTSIGYEGTDPEKDLIPLCSNCHSMIHREKPPYTPDEVKNILKQH